MACQFDAIVLVASVPRNWWFLELSCVLVTITKVHDASTLHHTFSEFAFIETGLILKFALPMEQSIHKPAFILKIRIPPPVSSLAIKLPVLKFSYVSVAIRFLKSALALNNVG
jgi:hypothetical protein